MTLWALPGPARFLQRIERMLRDGKSIVARFPGDTPMGFRERALSPLHDMLHYAAFRPEPAELPVEGLRRRFVPGLSENWGVSLRDLCEHEDFCGRLIWLDGLDALDKNDWLAWRNFLSDYAQASRGLREFERTLFVAVLEGAPPADPPDEDVALTQCDWRGVVDEMDLLLLAHERLGDRACGPVMRSLLAATVARVAAWDPDIAERLLDEADETILDPRCMLQSVASEKGWTSETAVAWEFGTASGDGTVHAAIASLENPPREIQRRLWSAQASVLLPEIDIWRRQFALENHALLASHLCRAGEETDPLDLDIGDLTGMVLRPGFDREARQEVRRMNNLRNDLAHLKPLPFHAVRLLAGAS